MKAIAWVAPVATVAIIFGTVGVAQATGVWVTSGRQAVVVGQQLGVDDLKGWMTLQQAADGLGMDVDRVIAVVGPPAGVTLTPATALKDLESLVPGFQMSAFREALRSALGQSAAPVPATPSAR